MITCAGSFLKGRGGLKAEKVYMVACFSVHLQKEEVWELRNYI
jgi:hypothetical protein